MHGYSRVLEEREEGERMREAIEERATRVGCGSISKNTSFSHLH
jgi:hypothetical protein